MERKKLSPQDALKRIQHYCAYQERSHQEARNKLYEYGLYSNQVEDILTQLITDGFLSEQRFAKAFAGGKFRMKKWGRLKIVRELESHGLTAKCIQTGLKEIDAGDYTDTLNHLVDKKWEATDEPNLFAKRNKVARFVIQKGFEPDLVWEVVSHRA